MVNISTGKCVVYEESLPYNGIIGNHWSNSMLHKLGDMLVFMISFYQCFPFICVDLRKADFTHREGVFFCTHIHTPTFCKVKLYVCYCCAVRYGKFTTLRNNFRTAFSLKVSWCDIIKIFQN